MADPASKFTDEELKKVEKQLKSVYNQAYKDILQKQKDFNSKHLEKSKKYLEKVAKGEMTQDQYDSWLKGQVFQGDQWQAKKKQMLNVIYNSNKTATDILNGKTRGVFAFNATYANYDLEHSAGINFGFGIYDTNTVINLVKNNPKLLPEWKIDQTKDYKWSQKKLNKQINLGILEGESLDKIATRLCNNLCTTNFNKMRTFARTAMTGAQNEGRLFSYENAKALGIKVKKQWMCTLDGHTRIEHQKLDGQTQDIDKPFEVDGLKIRYPGDPAAEAALVFNCRCTMVGDIEDYPATYDRYDNIDGRPIKQMTYGEWLDAKSKGEDISPVPLTSETKHIIVQGQDISSTWKRRPDKFDFEIEDVINAQGFDGKPRVVSAKEFDKAVREANNGNGFIAQRSYTAPDQETLDAYRKQLYEGKWYVDCSTGGAQYGQGMYCAASYDGQLNDGIITEMEHYSKLNQEKLSRNFSGMDKEEQKELLPSVLKEVAPELTSAQSRDFIDFFTYDRLGGAWDGSISFERAKEARTALRKSGINIGKIGADIDSYRTSACSYVETMTLDPSAKIITYKDIHSEFQGILTEAQEEKFKKKYWEDNLKNYSGDEKTFLKFNIGSSHGYKVKWKEVSSAVENISDDRQDELSEIAMKLKGDYSNKLTDYKNELRNNSPYMKGKYKDVGSYAASKGYDAINAEGHGQSNSYTVVLNRTKLIIKEP